MSLRKRELRYRLSSERRKLSADLWNTVAKLFVGGGLVGPFLNQIDISPISAAGAFLAGLAFHAVAHYILVEDRIENDGT